MNPRRQRITILGSTGSVGTSTLDVLALHPDRYEIFALTAHGRLDRLVAQCLQWSPRFVALTDAGKARELADRLVSAGSSTRVLNGAQALCDVAADPEVDTVMAAIVGAAGLAPCLAAARAGKRLLLANKEALVVGGALFMSAVSEGGATLLPVDSEHSAILQCLPEDRTTWAERVEHIVLTASGGPFRTRTQESLAHVTPDEACAHPNWVMGRKISVDSATMMNKALEVIEARWLFDLAPEQIRVVIHPQSIIHSMVVCRDSSVLAQLGTPDMKVPIACALAYPERIASGAASLDLLGISSLTFESADRARFPALHLSWDAMKGPEGTTAVLNAANEEAVAAFLAGGLRFTGIYEVNERAVAALDPALPDSPGLDDLLALDERARATARDIIKGLLR